MTRSLFLSHPHPPQVDGWKWAYVFFKPQTNWAKVARPKWKSAPVPWYAGGAKWEGCEFNSHDTHETVGHEFLLVRGPSNAGGNGLEQGEGSRWSALCQVRSGQGRP